MTNVTPHDSTPTPWMITGKLYDRLKFLALVLLPAISTLYFTMGNIWDFPSIEKVVGSIAALDTFIGVLLKVSNVAYDSSASKYSGAIDVEYTEEGTKRFTLDLGDTDPNDLDSMNEVTFKVRSVTGSQTPPA